MLFSIISSKGGTGCSVFAASLARVLSTKLPTLLIDACQGDLHSVVNLGDKPKHTFHQWCLSAEPSISSLEKISLAVKHNLNYVSSSMLSTNEPQDEKIINEHTSALTYEKRSQIIDSFTKINGDCVIDLGRRTDLVAKDIIEASDIVLMSMKQCYLSLEGATRYPFIKNVDVIAVLKESGRTIGVSQIADTLGIETVIEINARRDFAKVIDAGVLVSRTPKDLTQPIEMFVNDLKRDSIKDNTNNDDVFRSLEIGNRDNFWSRNEISFNQENIFSRATRLFS